MEIRTASGIDDIALRRFYVEMFPLRGDFLSEHWRWLYRVGRFPGIEPLVLVDGGRVVGHAGAIPLTISRLGVNAPAIWYVDFVVRPELQGQGHGKALSEAWMKMCPDRVTFCNERSIRVFLKLGWKQRFDARVCSLPIELSGPAAARGAMSGHLGRLFNGPWKAALHLLLSSAPTLNVRSLPQNPAALVPILSDAASAKPHIVRDEDWARWRLLDHPRSDEHRLAELNGVNAILRLFTSLGRRRAHLLHVGPGPAVARAAMVAAFARWALEQGADDAWMATNDQTLLTSAARYLPRRHSLRFAWHSDAAAVDAALAKTLETQALDSDHDLMFPC
jgi:GNAT superfamily N-acetyltransferase